MGNKSIGPCSNVKWQVRCEPTHSKACACRTAIASLARTASTTYSCVPRCSSCTTASSLLHCMRSPRGTGREYGILTPSKMTCKGHESQCTAPRVASRDRWRSKPYTAPRPKREKQKAGASGTRWLTLIDRAKGRLSGARRGLNGACQSCWRRLQTAGIARASSPWKAC